MKTFIHHNFKSLDREENENGRFYITEKGKYPSVTSVLSILNKDSILAWRKRVGEEEANRVSARAASRGTRMHTLCEQFLLTDEDPEFKLDVFGEKEQGAKLYESIKKYLNNIDNIHALESPLYSHHLQVAGTVDCVAEYEGTLSVIDFKSSSRLKTRDDIHSYFYQTAAYGQAFYELTGIVVKQSVIIMGIEDDKPLIFVEKIKDWLPEFMNIRKQYRKLKGV